jgi:excisionase family DNA binding protein
MGGVSMNDQTSWLRPDEACKYLRISRRTLSDWQKKRLVRFHRPAKKLILFKRADLDSAISKFAVQEVGS